MMKKIVDVDGGVTILGGAEVDSSHLAAALAVAPFLVAADGGAETALSRGHVPDLVVGDMDSLGAARRDVPPDRIIHLPEQETTDFEKCLYTVSAAFFLAVGVTGSRLDHALSAFNVLARQPAGRVAILGGEDLVFLSPPDLTLDLPVGTRLSLFPMAPVTGRSQGLEWPIDDIRLAPNGRVGTSNRISSRPARLRFDGAGMLVILPAIHLGAALRALAAR